MALSAEMSKAMINRLIVTAIVASASIWGADNSVAAELGKDANAAAAAVLRNYLPGTSGLGPIKVDRVDADDAARVLRVDCNENSAYIPLRAENLASIKAEVRAAMGKKYDGYRVEMYVVDRDRSGKEVARTNMDNLILFAPKRVIGPTEKTPFVRDLDADAAPRGLQNRNIALWQSHGWYFEPKLNRWEWQRARIFQTVEDLYTQSYVMPYLMPMLRNAGAYVMSPRERDVNTTEIIVDNDGGNASGSVVYGNAW